MEITTRRFIEYHQDDIGNKSYFFHGYKPLPKLLIDEIEGMVYFPLGTNSFNEKIYIKIPIDEYDW